MTGTVFCPKDYNCIVVLGPTAVGKTSLAVRLALETDSHIISADSRQVYRGLDIGSGKDLCEYTVDGKSVPYHLIDITDLSKEYSVFDYQQDFYRVFESLNEKGIVPVVAGGTGMYLDSVVRGYGLVPVPENPELRRKLGSYTLEELDAMLLELRPELHTRASLADRDRTMRAIEIETYMKEHGETGKEKPEVIPLIIGTSLPRESLKHNISVRLRERLDNGMIDEVRGLHDNGASWQRLENLGLEYKFVSDYLQGKIKSDDELFDLLNLAIGQFAKRQETWFRGMEKKGALIHWLPSIPDKELKAAAALNIIKAYIKR